MIVTFGDAIVDLFALPLGSDVSAAEQYVPRQGGAPANVAVVAARLGVPSRFVGAVGRDAHGQRLIDCLRADGVDTTSMVMLSNRTGITFVRVSESGERAFLFYREGGADLALCADDLETLPASPLRDASWLHVMSSALLTPEIAGATERMLSWAEDLDVPVSMDLNVRAHLWNDREKMNVAVRRLSARASIVKASEEDLVALDQAPTLDSLRALPMKKDAVAILTLAERGAVAFAGSAAVRVPAPVVKAIDATGAGDAFMGTLLAGCVLREMKPGSPAWQKSDAWIDVLQIACRVGARAVTALGATEGVRELQSERAQLQLELHSSSK